MRYLHNDVAAIRKFADENHLYLTRVAPKDSQPLQILDYSAINEMLEASQKLSGLALPFYVIASKKGVEESYSLRDAVTDLESLPKSDNFILVAYQDGGVISISNKILPFQHDADRADWWVPAV